MLPGTLLRGAPALGATQLPSFTTPLPIPVKATPASANRYRLTLRQFTQQLHPKLPRTTLWGYDDGSGIGPLYPGPTIEVQSGTPTSVSYQNRLPTTQLLPFDPALTGGDTRVRIQTHVHGLFVDGADDGNPYATPNEFTRGQTQRVDYPNEQSATTLWYHDHALGATRLNVYAGLAAFYIIRDQYDTGAEPNPIGVPGGAYEIPIAIQDKSFTSTGQLFYSPTSTWIPEFFGDQVVVNGAVSPYLNVEPRKYRFRFLNGCNARFWNLEIAGGPPLHQIGAEQGMFDRPVAQQTLVMVPAERADVIVDFSAYAGQTLVLKNRGLPAGVVSPATPNLSNIMQFRVGTTVTSPGPSTIPTSLPGSAANLPAPVQTRNITLEEVLDPAGNPIKLVISGLEFMDPVTEKPKVGTVEDWRFVNLSADTHPMHMHLTKFQVVDRVPIDVAAYQAALDVARAANQPNPDPAPFATGPAQPPYPKERGYKDTAGANPAEVLRIRQKFDLPSGVNAPQKYVYHCHIVEHEDNDMMRPYEVVR
jgi:spore coat protein A